MHYPIFLFFFSFSFLLFSLNLLQISLKVKQFLITGCQAYATVTSHFSWYQKQPSTRAHSWNTAGSNMSPNSTEQVKKILTHHFFQVCIAASLAAVGRRLMPQRAGSVWEQFWEHGKRMLWLFHRLVYAKSAERNLSECFCYKPCFLENNFCFTWDILGLVLGINF